MISLSGFSTTVSSFSPFRSTCLGPVMIKDMLLVLLPPPPQKNQILTLNLISAAKKTNCWSCVLRVHELSSNSTLDGLTRNKRLTWVTYCMRYLKTHKQTEKLLMFKPYPSCLTYLCRPKVLGLHQHVRVTIQTFSGGCDALESHWSSLSPSHPHMKDSPREQMSILAPSKEDI